MAQNNKLKAGRPPDKPRGRPGEKAAPHELSAPATAASISITLTYGSAR